MGDSAKTDAPKGSFWKGVKTELNKISMAQQRRPFETVSCCSVCFTCNGSGHYFPGYSDPVRN